MAEGGRRSQACSWSPSCSLLESWEVREALFPSCSLLRSRSKCRAERLGWPVYIGLGVGLEIHQRLVQFGMANSHWSVSYPQIREGSTPRAAWLIWGRCPVGLTGSLVLECWNEAGRLSAQRPSAHHDYTLLLSLLFLLLFFLF